MDAELREAGRGLDAARALALRLRGGEVHPLGLEIAALCGQPSALALCETPRADPGDADTLLLELLRLGGRSAGVWSAAVLCHESARDLPQTSAVREVALGASQAARLWAEAPSPRRARRAGSFADCEERLVARSVGEATVLAAAAAVARATREGACLGALAHAFSAIMAGRVVRAVQLGGAVSCAESEGYEPLALAELRRWLGAAALAGTSRAGATLRRGAGTRGRTRTE